MIVDGFVATAAVAVLHAMDPSALDHCIFAHRSAESAHGRALEHMGKEPLLDLGMRLGEGTGAALAAGSTWPVNGRADPPTVSLPETQCACGSSFSHADLRASKHHTVRIPVRASRRRLIQGRRA